MSGEANKTWRFWREPEFWLLLVATLGATFGLSVWIVVTLTVAGLSISSLPKYIALWPRAHQVVAHHDTRDDQRDANAAKQSASPDKSPSHRPSQCASRMLFPARSAPTSICAHEFPAQAYLGRGTAV